ncbi:MAG: DUF1127 domain-containing protein [Paracoccaceae bacterium]
MSTQACTETAAKEQRPGKFSFLRLIPKFDAIYRQRLDLRGLSDTALKDIGITRSQANAEASRPSWDAPSHWLR